MRENLDLGAYYRTDKQAVAGDLERVFETFPILRERLRLPWRKPQRRTTADARDRPGHDEPAAAPDARRDRIRLDEMNFIDMDRTVSMTAAEHVIRPGTGGSKVVIVSRRAVGVAADDFARRYATDYVNAVLSSTVCDRMICGWSVNHVLGGSFRLPGGRPATAAPVDCIEEVWFGSDQDTTHAFDVIASSGAIQRASR